MSEAVEAVNRMLRAYPNARDGLRDGYIGVLAELLTRYPRQVALRCAHPIDGVGRECKFLPTVSEAVSWLERETLPYRKAVDWQRQTDQQFRERAAREREEKAEPLEHRRKVAERITRELEEAFAANKGEIYNVFVPTFAWQPFSAEALRALYPRRETPSDQSNAI